jgi:GNAT superfamily N-acetyltransferase
MQFSIQPVAVNELSTLLELIRELARFERLEHEVEATVELLQESLFGAQPVAGALLARYGGEPVGYALYFFTFSSFIGRPGLWLDDVYVRPAYRQRGLGCALIKAVAQIGLERKCGRFEWTALNWNTNALDFYRRLGATSMDNWTLLRMNAQALRGLAASAAPVPSKE